MKVFVAGAGIMGLQIARTLRDEGNQVTVLELDPDRVDRVKETLGASVKEGDCCDPQILERCGLTGHDALLALTGDDEDNLVVSLLAKSQFEVGRVVARINDPRNSWLFDENWGIDVAMSAPMILLSLVEEATSAAPTVNLMELATAGVRVLEMSVGPASPLIGKMVDQLALPEGVVIATVVRQGTPLAATGEVEIAAGDKMLVVAKRSVNADLDRILSAG